MDPQPLITHIYTADPSANVFNNRLYIYPSHDRETTTPDNDSGDQYDMADYHVFSLSSLHPHVSDIEDHGIVLSTSDVPWASKQLWAPDAATRNGKYYLVFPARDHEGIFRIGVAISEKPSGPFIAEKNYIKGSFSIDPCIFVDDDVGDKRDGDGKEAFLYFGGIWGGQLQCWQGEEFDKKWEGPLEPSSTSTSPHTPSLMPKVAKMSADMLNFITPVQDLILLNSSGTSPIPASDHEKRFFEAAWMHKRGGKYYFSYSTGDTHFICYAIGDSPMGPFRYAGRLLEPVMGWTSHHSIVEFGGRWWLFYHDASLSRGRNHLRCVKAREIVYDGEGRMFLKDPQPELGEEDVPKGRLEE